MSFGCRYARAQTPQAPKPRAEDTFDVAAWLLKTMEPVARALAQDAAFARAAADPAKLTQEHVHVRAVLGAVDVKALLEREILAGVQSFRTAAGSCGEARLAAAAS